MLRSRLLLTTALLGALGCQAETFGAGKGSAFEGESIQVPAIEVWPGATISLKSSGFTLLPDTSGELWIEGRMAIAQRTADSLFEVRIPTTLGAGRHSFELRFEGDTGHGTIATGGVTGTTLIGNIVSSTAQPWPWEAPAGALISDPAGKTFYLDAATGRQTAIPGLPYSGSYGPGLSYRPGVALFAGPSGTYLATIDHLTGAFTLDSAPWSFERLTFELSPGVALITSNHWARTVGGVDTAYWNTESPWYFPISPDRRYGTFVANALQDWTTPAYGLPIVDMTTGGLARTLAGIGSTDAVAWHPDSRSLYVAARPYWAGVQQLVRMDVTTGDTLASASTEDSLWSDGGEWALAFDGQRDLLYGLTTRSGSWQLVVRDPATLAVVGTAGLGKAECTAFGIPFLFIDRSAWAVHALVPSCGGTSLVHARIPR